jgi:hypothetical protein
MKKIEKKAADDIIEAEEVVRDSNFTEEELFE